MRLKPGGPDPYPSDPHYPARLAPHAHSSWRRERGLLGVAVHLWPCAPSQSGRNRNPVVPRRLSDARPRPAWAHGSCSTNPVRTGAMAVTKELLQMDLYALLGIEEQAADKEVRTVARKADPERPGGLSCPGAFSAVGTSAPGLAGFWAGSVGRPDSPRSGALKPFLDSMRDLCRKGHSGSLAPCGSTLAAVWERPGCASEKPDLFAPAQPQPPRPLLRLL